MSKFKPRRETHARSSSSIEPSQTHGLQEDDASFRILFTENPQPMWVYDLSTLQFLEVNSAAIQYYGYSREEFLGKRIIDIRPQEDVPRVLEDIANMREGLQYSANWRHTLKDGRVIDVEITSHTLVFRGRRAELVVIRDITKEKLGDEALKQAEKKYRSIFEEAIVGIFQSTPDGRLLSVNPAMAHLFGYESAQEMMESIQNVRPQLYVEPTRRDDFIRMLEEESVVKHFELQVYRKDGSKMWLAANARVVREDDAVVRYEGTFEDINERKLLEGQLRQAQKMEAVGRLAGGVAHDFNNALAVITGYGDLLQLNLPPDDPLRKHAEEISKAGRRAAALTRQLLGFSRKQVIHPVVLDLNSVIGELQKMLHRLIGEDIEVSFKRDPMLGRVKVDPSQIEQILMNLAVNARDAMPKGGKLCIETSNAELDETYARQNAYVTPGSYVMLSVSDTGSGMDKQTQTHIFEPFFTTKDPGKGTGLGLSTVYGIVKQNLGYIQVYSEVDKGATFKIHFPRVREAAKQPRTLILPTLPGGAETILLVEDEEPLRKLAFTCLKGSGYSVLDASDAAKAMVLANEHAGKIDLLLTDVVMPGASGKDLATQLTAARPGLKVLYMSGYTGDLIAQHGVLEEGTLLLEKPFTLHSLLSKVREALGADSAKAASAN